MAVLLAIAIVATVGAGGLRSMSWAVAAAALASLIALIIPAGIVATEVTNFPLAQFSYGPTLRAVGRLEDIRGVATPLLSPLAFDLATPAIEPLTHRMSSPFGSLGPASYILVTFALMMGIAVAPWLVPRIGATPGIYEARKSYGWAVFVFGSVVLTLSAYAVFERDIVMEHLVGQSAATLPDWLQRLVASGDAAVDGRLPQLPLSSFSFKRDTLLFMLPVASHLPRVLLYLVMTGVIAAAFCGACSGVLTFGSMIAEDVINGSQWEAPAKLTRLSIARAATAIAAVAGAALALALPADPLQLAIWAIGLSGATAFPVVVLSIWWKRLNTLGAMAGIGAGFVVAALGITAGEANWFGVPSEVVSVFAVPFGFVAAFFGTRVGAPPSRNVLEMVRDMRVPGGETVHDREQRLLRLKRRQRPA
jgi:cation/acetate symporter